MQDAIKVDDELAALIPPLTPGEAEILERSITEAGAVRDALVGWKEAGILIDGHNRYRIARKHGIAYRVDWKSFPSREAVRAWMAENQLGRRNLTDDQRAAVALELVKARAAVSRAEKAAKAGEAGGRGRPADSLEDGPAPELSRPAERVRAAVAAETRVPERKIRAVAAIEKAKPDLIPQIAAGVTTIAAARREAGLSEPAPRIVPSKSPTPADPALPTHDEEGGLLPESLRPTFACLPTWRSILAQHNQYLSAIRKLCEQPGASRLKRHLQDIESRLKGVRQVLSERAPHAVCADCRGTGKAKSGDQCLRCGGAGWIDIDTHKRRRGK